METAFVRLFPGAVIKGQKVGITAVFVVNIYCCFGSLW